MTDKFTFITIFIFFISFKEINAKNCSLVPYSNLKYSQNGNGECICIQGYTWNNQKTQCIKKSNIHQQSNIQYQKQSRLLRQLLQNKYWQDSCLASIDCPQGETWNSSFYQCVLNCSEILYGGEVNPQNYTACLCQIGYKWNSQLSVCYRNCSTDANSTGNYQDQITGECKCKNGFSWNSTLLYCIQDPNTASKVYVPIVAVAGSVAVVALIAWPVTIILKKMGIIGVAHFSNRIPQGEGIIGASPFQTTHFVHSKGIQNML